MAPDATSPFMFIQQILLVVFVLMVLVSIVGGKPETVLKPVFDITGHLIMAVVTLICQLTVTLFGAILSLFVSGVRGCSRSSHSGASRDWNR